MLRKKSLMLNRVRLLAWLCVECWNLRVGSQRRLFRPNSSNLAHTILTVLTLRFIAVRTTPSSGGARIASPRRRGSPTVTQRAGPISKRATVTVAVTLLVLSGLDGVVLILHREDELALFLISILIILVDNRRSEPPAR